MGEHRRTGSSAARVGALVIVMLVLLIAGIVVVHAVGLGAGPAGRVAASPGSVRTSPRVVASPPATSPTPTATITPATAVVPRPRITWRPIPFPASRRREMAAYARRHYGIDSWRLIHPKVIVEHFTAGGTYASAWNTFARDVPDQEFHSLPADCAHFVIDTDGTIHQLVPLGIMCRHTVGLNWTSVGIEMVGTSDAQVLANPRELRSAIRLTAWLMGRLHIQLRNVIGHNESLDSPFHRERLAAWRCQTHGDWQHADMGTLRGDIARYLRRFRVLPGPPWRAHPQAGC